MFMNVCQITGDETLEVMDDWHDAIVMYSDLLITGSGKILD